MSRHLEKCAERQARIAGAAETTRKPESLYYLRVQDAYSNEFWLDLEVRGSATMKDIDTYLRGIWLECCGHLSEFSVGGWGSGKIGKQKRIEAVFALYEEVTHIYDFGTSSETKIKGVERREGVPLTAKPIVLMARNKMPEVVCQDCEEPATHLCMECMNEFEASGLLCDTHAETHPHDDYGSPVPLVNSPRLGMCGYEGPADPPY